MPNGGVRDRRRRDGRPLGRASPRRDLSLRCERPGRVHPRQRKPTREGHRTGAGRARDARVLGRRFLPPRRRALPRVAVRRSRHREPAGRSEGRRQAADQRHARRRRGRRVRFTPQCPEQGRGIGARSAEHDVSIGDRRPNGSHPLVRDRRHRRCRLGRHGGQRFRTQWSPSTPETETSCTEIGCIDDVLREPAGSTFQAALSFDTTPDQTYYGAEFGGFRRFFSDTAEYGRLRVAVR